MDSRGEELADDESEGEESGNSRSRSKEEADCVSESESKEASAEKVSRVVVLGCSGECGDPGQWLVWMGVRAPIVGRFGVERL